MFKSVIIALLFSIFIVSSDYLITETFSWLSTGLFFLFILFITLFCKRYKFIYLILILSGTLHHLFFSYFHRTITATDIYLFFTHIEETFESFYALASLFVTPVLLLFFGLSLLWALHKIKAANYPLRPLIKYPLLLLFITMNLNSTMGLQLVDALSHISLKEQRSLQLQESPLYPKKDVDLNIVLLIGESMKFDDYVENKLKKQGFFYKKIYSGATNTDVVIPLLLNTKTNPLELRTSNETNLFKLAKKNNFNTTFISIQSEKSLHYITPYLQVKYIDTYKSYESKERESKFDLFILDELQKRDLSKNNFMVFQQIGQHSPYYYFEGEKSDDPRVNYIRSVDTSFKLYNKLYRNLKNSHKPFVFIYVSDHGEFTGEKGRYGHNSFDPVVYHVPMFITSNIVLPSAYKEIKSHYHISQFLTYLLGYKEKLEFSEGKSIINGTMLSREDGFIEIE